MAKLSKTQQYAVQYLHSQNKSAEDISSELKLSLTQVKSLLEKTKPIAGEAKTDRTKNLMIRQTSAKKQNSVSIMTEAASQLGDEFIKSAEVHKKRTEGYIFRPQNNE
ncbi:MAG: hypothetical protein ACKO7N_06750 [Candidatus Nitrosotenuis sp.]